MAIKIGKDCTGCGSCVDACPFGAIEIQEGQAVINAGCTACGACVEVCPENAISVAESREPRAESRAAADWRGVWVFAEQRQGEIAPVVYELLGEGRRLADKLKVGLSAVLLGAGVAKLADELIAHGADRVYLVENRKLEDSLDEPYAAALTRLIVEGKPEIVLAGATALGRSLMPKVAARLKTGLTADCTGLDIDQKKRLLLQTRPTFGGNLMATIVCPERRPQMATVRPRVMKKSEPNQGRQGEVVKKTVPEEAFVSRVKLLGMAEEIVDQVKLEEADIVVAGGRGLGDKDGFKLVEELAAALGGAVAASRSCVDQEWVSYPHQVGQTGKTVCPKLYIACGISGAIQHLAGMQTSDVIVAINKDPDAPIFDVATYAIVGDVKEVLPQLTAEIKKARGAARG